MVTKFSVLIGVWESFCLRGGNARRGLYQFMINQKQCRQMQSVYFLCVPACQKSFEFSICITTFILNETLTQWISMHFSLRCKIVSCKEKLQRNLTREQKGLPQNLKSPAQSLELTPRDTPGVHWRIRSVMR